MADIESRAGTSADPQLLNDRQADFEARYGQFGGVETRIVPIEVRATENGDPNSEYSIDGHASVFNKESLDLGYYTEFIEPGAFDDALRGNPDVVANWDHDNRYVLGRTANKTLRLNTDAQGLAYWVRVAPTSYAADLRILLERGDINQASFAFTVEEDVWEIKTVDGEEVVTRTIIKIGMLYDVCVTAQGAYPQTDSQVSRSYVRAAAESRIAARSAAAAPVEERAVEDQARCACGAFVADGAEECAACGMELHSAAVSAPSVRVVQARVKARAYKLQH